MSNKGLVVSLSISLVILALTSALPRHAIADQSAAAHRSTADNQNSEKRHDQAGELVRIVRESTRRFHDVNQAMKEGYELAFGCVSGPDDGAMGLHYVNMDLVNDGILDPRRPEIILYEPLPDGGRRLTGADFLVLVDTWHSTNTATPQLGGQLLHLFESPNRFGLPAFYTLHVWAWKPSPTGAFVNWHSDVSCEQFDGQ